MEFLSEIEGGEYSSKPTYPPGKWFFYEQVLKVPNYIIFEPDAGLLEVYCLDNSGQYRLRQSDDGRYWIEEMQLFLGVWQGTRGNRTSYWLRWWDNSGSLLLWGLERATQAEQSKCEAIPRLLKMGLSRDQIAEALELPLETVQQTLE